jgi:hypothetical protein
VQNLTTGHGVAPHDEGPPRLLEVTTKLASTKLHQVQEFNTKQNLYTFQHCWASSKAKANTTKEAFYKYHKDM